MGMSWAILAPFIALAITGAAMQAAVFVTGAIRRHDYLLFEDGSAPSVAQRFPLPKVDPSTAEARRKSLSPFVDKAHKAANAAQTIYYNAVVRSAGCLVLAFLALAFGTFRPEDWPASWDWPSVELLLNWLDVIAILFVLVLFFYGRRASPPWIASRAGVELLRQYQFLDVVLPSAISPVPTDDLKTQFDSEAHWVSAETQRGEITEIVARIERFWSERKASIANHTLTEADFTAEALLLYLEKRVRRQLGWFIDSKDRLEYIAERRNKVLLVLYVLMAALASIKFVLLLYGGNWHHYLLPFLLLVTGMSAAMTAYYFNQNARSLIHRYNTQQRFITSWLVAFNERWNFAGLPSLTIEPVVRIDMRAQILRFEDLMIEELIDWIHITSHDAIELAP